MANAFARFQALRVARSSASFMACAALDTQSSLPLPDMTRSTHQCEFLLQYDYLSNSEPGGTSRFAFRPIVFGGQGRQQQRPDCLSPNLINQMQRECFCPRRLLKMKTFGGLQLPKNSRNAPISPTAGNYPSRALGSFLTGTLISLYTEKGRLCSST